MSIKKAHLIILLSGLFLLSDQFLKWLSTHKWNASYLLWNRVGWEPFANTGVAFSLPIPNQVTIFITLPIIFLVAYLLITELKKPAGDFRLLLAWSAIFCGATSNFVDRLFYSYVRDYFIIGTAIINLADIMIVFGLGIYMLRLFGLKKV